MPANRCAPAMFGAALLGSAALFSTGCYTYPPYGGNSYPSNPGFYSSPPPGVYSSPGPYGPGMYQPGQPLAPGGSPDLGPGSTIPPGGGFPPGGALPPGGGTFAPGGSYPPAGSSYPPGGYPSAPFPSGGQPTPANPDTWRGSSAPPASSGYQPLPPPRSSSGAPQDKPVPTYNDDFNNQPFKPDSSRAPRGSASPTGTRGTTPRSFQNENDGPTPFSSGQVPPPETDIDTVASARPTQPDGLTESASVDGPTLIPGETVVLASAVSAEASGGGDPLYAYDRQSYQWLRGAVDYDENEETWFIIYSLAPEEGDHYQGALTLDATEGTLANLKNGDYVLVKGQVDPRQVDRRNAPVYRVEEAHVVKR